MERRTKGFPSIFIILGAIAGLLIVAACADQEPSVPTNYTLDVSIAGSGTGNVTSTPPGIDIATGDDAPASATFAEGTVVTLSASAAGNSTFTGWTGSCSGTEPCVLTLDADVSVTANFAAAGTATLAVTTTGSGSGNVTSTPAGIDLDGGANDASFEIGEPVTLTATPDTGFAFGGWAGGMCSGTDACELVITDDVTINADFFDPVADVSTQEFTIQSGSDDAEEFLSFVNEFYNAGGTQIGSSDLDFTWDTAFDVEVMVGLRYANVNVPLGAVITDASIAFTRQAAGLGQVTLRFEGEAIDDAPTFVDGPANFNISDRDRTSAAVDWFITDPWAEPPATEVSPDLSAIVSEIIQRDGWEASNALAFIISSEDSDENNYRRADSYEANPDTAPVLSITYYVPGAP